MPSHSWILFLANCAHSEKTVFLKVEQRRIKHCQFIVEKYSGMKWDRLHSKDATCYPSFAVRAADSPASKYIFNDIDSYYGPLE